MLILFIMLCQQTLILCIHSNLKWNFHTVHYQNVHTLGEKHKKLQYLANTQTLRDF